MTSPPTEVDELSVIQVAIDGMRLRLKRRERDEAIRMMQRRVDVDIIAWRLFTTHRTLQRVMARLSASQSMVPACDLDTSLHEPSAA